MAYKAGFIGTIVLAVILIGRPITLCAARSQTQQSYGTDKQRKAIAFLLGWDSKLVLVQKTTGGRQQYLANIRSEVHQLNLSLTHPVEYYFHYPVTDEGLRAQAFADETMALLKNVDPDSANHFGVAHNLLLSIRHTDMPEAIRREELEELVQFLDIPADLKKKPEEGIVTWVDEIHQYFLLTAHRQVKTRLKVTGTSE